MNLSMSLQSEFSFDGNKKTSNSTFKGYCNFNALDAVKRNEILRDDI